ncbi:hypothetical protein GOBAR_AA14916 [Gossypium barbadense]|uniref:Uncharacterized protein n=1 Tax=Gossypium barbadense TaxID=3634 RepID=A0A2P5XQX3_GOSBA|nr:hypothetical protein GOBAR_AA14916 [Gossypium barbadense]
MPSHRDRGSMEDDGLPRDDAQVGRVEHFLSDMVRALQCIAGANVAPTHQGLPLECLRALSGKEFRGVRGGDPTRTEYWLEGIVRILG